MRKMGPALRSLLYVLGGGAIGVLYSFVTRALGST